MVEESSSAAEITGLTLGRFSLLNEFHFLRTDLRLVSFPVPLAILVIWLKLDKRFLPENKKERGFGKRRRVWELGGLRKGREGSDIKGRETVEMVNSAALLLSDMAGEG